MIRFMIVSSVSKCCTSERGSRRLGTFGKEAPRGSSELTLGEPWRVGYPPLHISCITCALVQAYWCM